MLSLTHFVVEFKTKFMTLRTNFKIHAQSSYNLLILMALHTLFSSIFTLLAIINRISACVIPYANWSSLLKHELLISIQQMSEARILRLSLGN